jgi:tetratricopeptide (TPR) repeat protein
MKAGNRPAALANWKRAVELDPRDFDALYNLASELLKDGQLNAARPYLERFVREAPRAAYTEQARHLSELLESRAGRGK